MAYQPKLMRTRFAPSPTGPLHLGHAFSALTAAHFAQSLGGEFLLRIEDIDQTRARPEWEAQIYDDLTWLGLTWPTPVMRQSDRMPAYRAALQTLWDMDLLYPCTCKRRDIEAAMSAPQEGAPTHGPDGLIYPGTCRHRAVAPEGAVWRLDVTAAMNRTGPLEWLDEGAGPQAATPQIFGDVVLLRKDLPASYHLAATLDDAADGITLVTRGMDLFRSSHVHRLLQALLDLPVPVWHHHGLLVEADGRKLAKRRGSPSLADRRRAGEDGLAIADALRAQRFPAGISLSQALNGTP